MIQRFLSKASLVALSFFIVVLVAGCSRKAGQDHVNKSAALLMGVDPTPAPYQGNLTPERAAEITSAVARVSLIEIPTKDLPQDSKNLMELNERIQQKSSQVYARYQTSMAEVMQYISDLKPADRERYNQKLTELFLENSKTR